jgi:hypothetical protein
MLKTESLKKYIDEVIAEIENELDEATATGDIAGYETPNAFSDGSDATKRRKKKIATQLGMQLVGKVESVNESLITEKQFKGLEGISATTPLTKITKDQKLKIVKGVGNIIDFIVPKGVSRNFWQVIGTGKVKKNLSGEYYLEGKIINSPMFKSMDDLINGIKWDSMEERRRFNESVNEDKSWKRFLDPYTWFKSNDMFQHRFKNVSPSVVEELIKITKKNGHGVLIVGKNAFAQLDKNPNELEECVWKYYNGVLYYTNLRNKSIYDTLIPKLVNSKNELKMESVNENRWLELKNDDSMHANKKLAVGLKELKNQLSEVEKFFRWYNQIKTMNELDSNQYWKRTNSHIYKIKERIINIARTLQEIEK